MAKSIDEILCENMYKFVKEHFYEITTPIKELGFSSKKDLLAQIKKQSTRRGLGACRVMHL